MKIAVITCSPQPDYVRARVLRAAVKQIPGVQIVVVKNTKTGFGRYLEVLGKIITVQRQEKPDAFLLTFRGYEILPFLLLIAGRTPVIFDEFINATEWIVDEHRLLGKNSGAAKLLNWWYGRQLKKCALILADTPAHAEYSSKRSNVSLGKYLTLPVGTDETVFRPNPRMTYMSYGQGGRKFQVFYYGSMLPLHGLDVVLAAAEQLKNDKTVKFLLVGGGTKAAAKIAVARQKGAHVQYKSWINFEQLPQTIAESALCLAGPFGGTLQGSLVITGKAYQFLAGGAPTVIGQNQASGDFINKQNALVVQQNHATALAETIRWAAAHRPELPKIGQAGRILFEQKFSTAVIARRLGERLETSPNRE